MDSITFVLALISLSFVLTSVGGVQKRPNFRNKALISAQSSTLDVSPNLLLSTLFSFVYIYISFGYMYMYVICVCVYV